MRNLSKFLVFISLVIFANSKFTYNSSDPSIKEWKLKEAIKHKMDYHDYLRLENIHYESNLLTSSLKSYKLYSKNGTGTFEKGSTVKYFIYGYSTKDVTPCEVNNIVKKAFRMWEEIGDLRFEKTKYPMSANITISFLSPNRDYKKYNEYFSGSRKEYIAVASKKVGVLLNDKYNWRGEFGKSGMRAKGGYVLIGGDPNMKRHEPSSECVFPFYYAGEWRYNCVAHKYGDINNRFWCGKVPNVRRENEQGSCHKGPGEVFTYYQDLQRVMVHEIGHVLGMHHNENRVSIMYQTNTIRDELDHLSYPDNSAMIKMYGRQQQKLPPLDFDECPNPLKKSTPNSYKTTAPTTTTKVTKIKTTESKTTTPKTTPKTTTPKIKASKTTTPKTTTTKIATPKSTTTKTTTSKSTTTKTTTPKSTTTKTTTPKSTTTKTTTSTFLTTAKTISKSVARIEDETRKLRNSDNEKGFKSKGGSGSTKIEKKSYIGEESTKGKNKIKSNKRKKENKKNKKLKRKHKKKKGQGKKKVGRKWKGKRKLNRRRNKNHAAYALIFKRAAKRAQAIKARKRQRLMNNSTKK